MSYPINGRFRVVGSGNGIRRAGPRTKRGRCKYCGGSVFWKKESDVVRIWNRETDTPHVCDPEKIYAFTTKRAEARMVAFGPAIFHPSCMDDIHYLIEPIAEEDILMVNLRSLGSVSCGIPQLDSPYYAVDTLFQDLKDKLSQYNINGVLPPLIDGLPEFLSDFSEDDHYFPTSYTYLSFGKVSKYKVPSKLHFLPTYSLFSVMFPDTARVVKPNEEMVIDNKGGLVRYNFLEPNAYLNQSRFCTTILMSSYYEDSEYIYLVGSAENERVSYELDCIVEDHLPDIPHLISYVYQEDPRNTGSICRLPRVPLTAILSPGGGWRPTHRPNPDPDEAYGGLIWTKEPGALFTGGSCDTSYTLDSDWAGYRHARLTSVAQQVSPWD